MLLLLLVDVFWACRISHISWWPLRLLFAAEYVPDVHADSHRGGNAAKFKIASGTNRNDSLKFGSYCSKTILVPTFRGAGAMAHAAELKLCTNFLLRDNSWNSWTKIIRGQFSLGQSLQVIALGQYNTSPQVDCEWRRCQHLPPYTCHNFVNVPKTGTSSPLPHS